MKYRMINKEILVKPILASENKTDGGIYLKPDFEPRVMRGEVLAIAKDCDEDIKVGDIVIFHKLAGVDRVIKDSALGNPRVIRELDIEAIEE